MSSRAINSVLVLFLHRLMAKGYSRQEVQPGASPSLKYDRVWGGGEIVGNKMYN